VRLPKQAKPAFLVEAPNGTAFRSIIRTDFSGCFSLMAIAVQSPENPEPIMTISFLVEGFQFPDAVHA
jgi:hypothetical protein